MKIAHDCKSCHGSIVTEAPQKSDQKIRRRNMLTKRVKKVIREDGKEKGLISFVIAFVNRRRKNNFTTNKGDYETEENADKKVTKYRMWKFNKQWLFGVNVVAR
ncbi:hypothetical protein [Streptococcus canis]|nr:hypothetical protein [Streptococcus canis]